VGHTLTWGIKLHQYVLISIQGNTIKVTLFKVNNITRWLVDPTTTAGFAIDVIDDVIGCAATRITKPTIKNINSTTMSYSSGSVLPLGKNFSVGNPLTPNLLPKSLWPSASTLAIRTSLTLSNAFPTSS